MNKKLMVGALAVALTGGGIIGAALLPSTNAAASDAAAPASTTPVQNAQPQQDNDKEVNDDGAQDKQDNDKEVSDDGAEDNDKEVNDDGGLDNDKEVNDDGAQAASITKQQSIDAALKQTAGTVSDVQLETENGVTAYTVTIKDAAGTQHEVTVDATTGKVIPEND